ncbi:hypothetical protein Lepto7375DRAFT_8330 [Leptolyngbya sp. PCC 7375]|nr:hypothetical protein Lepto7375DRAFT_8330 [Leptolyngbya sp. PCC 7375]
MDEVTAALSDIHVHDSELHLVIEDPLDDFICYEIMYPENWDEDRFEPKTLVFRNALKHAIEEGPFHGRPTLLAWETGRATTEGRVLVRLDTNAGFRSVECSEVVLHPGWDYGAAQK